MRPICCFCGVRCLTDYGHSPIPVRYSPKARSCCKCYNKTVLPARRFQAITIKSPMSRSPKSFKPIFFPSPVPSASIPEESNVIISSYDASMNSTPSRAINIPNSSNTSPMEYPSFSYPSVAPPLFSRAINIPSNNTSPNTSPNTSSMEYPSFSYPPVAPPLSYSVLCRRFLGKSPPSFHK